MAGTNEVVKEIFDRFFEELAKTDLDAKLICNLKTLVDDDKKITLTKLEKIIFDDSDEI